ncbi:MAG: tRNA pseudouridine(55) synthase TruB [Chloroflexota bacterium]|nr:tRNA pseudouridine(55) synthase TruB [Chloroflexota bacterium]
MDGILIVDKPAGLTSHDVVAKVRRAARMKKVGHAGTLDPLATGVLVLALGKATRTIEYLTEHDKVYEARLRLGQSTTTYDAEGEVVTRHEGALPARETVDAALDHFQGDILQKPPIYSAIKKGGEALYEKARRGESVEVAPRPVTIYTLEMTDWAPPEVGLHVHCSKGTYIRSLAHDLGEALGVGAYLSTLRRTASGSFSLNQAHPLDAITDATCEEIESLLLPVGAGLDALPMIEVDEAAQQALRHGRSLSSGEGEGLVRAVDENGHLIAILQWHPDRGWQPVKVFVS